MEENQPERGNLRESHVERRAGKEGNHSTVKMLTWMLAAAGLLVTFAPHIALSHDQTINTRLVAPWASTPVLDEAAEFMADVSRSVYWSFVEGLWDRMDHFPPPTSDDMAGDLAAVVAFNLIPSSKLRMMEWALRSRAYSPRVLSLQQLAPDSVPPTCEETFVAVNGKILCDVGELETILKSIRQGGVSDGSKGPVVTDSDHKYPSIIWSQLETNPVPIVVLYGQLTNIQTRTLHNILKTGGHSWGYIFRPYTPKKQMSKDKLVLSGYGIELQFKSQEYKAQDDSNVNSEDTGEVGGFLFNRLNELHPGAGESLEKLQNHLATSKSKKSEFEALKAWQVQELGLQASHFVTLQDDFLGALLDVSGNFPSRAAGLSSVKVPADFKRAVAFNQRLISSQFNLDEGEGAFFLQGSYLDLDSLDLFTFMDNIKVELEFMELLRSLRSDKGDLKKDEVSKILALGTKTSADPELALDLRDSSIFWINDLEKDEEYEDWPDDLTQLFFRMGGIMLRPVRRNVFNLVITLDPSDNTNCAGLLKMVQSFMAHKSPVRIGVVFTVPSEKTEQTEIVRRIFNYAVTEGKTRQVFNDVVQAYSTEDFSKLETRYAEKAGDEYDFGEGLAIEFVRRSGRGAPAAFLNGVPLKWDSVDDFEEVVLNQLLREAQSVQVDAYNGRVNDDTDIFEYLMNKPNVQTRLNDKILDVSNSKWLSFGTEVWEPEKRLQNDMAKLAATMSYLIPSGKRKSPVTTTVWIFADTEQEDGRRFLLQALEFLSESAVHSRLSFIPTSKQLSQSGRSLVKSFEAGDAKEAKKVLESWSSSGDMTVNENGLKFMEVLELGESSKGVVVNGRLIGPLGPTETFELGDWSLIEKFSHDSCPKHLIHSGVTDSEDWDADSMMRLCSALSNPSFKKSSKRFTLPDFQRAFTIPADRISSPFDVDLTAVVDPASRHAHKMAAILSAVEETVGQWVRIQVVFNPPSKHSELPLKSYYRYVAGHKSEEEVIFENIPRDPLFTQNIQAPDNWMVEVVKCDKDLDNIRLSDQGSQSVESEYELEYLLVEGHCLETKSGSPPRGLQFTLTPENSNAKASETIVMANLGYFQLKSSPGLWTLDLRDGPSKDIFALETHKNKPVSVNSFQSVVLKVKVKRNPGKESASLLDSEEESQQGWFNFGTNSKNEVKEETINVFSVASGHLYERLLKIMMLSVLKHTKSPVKFWFLKNYLSPTVKDILPKMAKEYGFEYELVQYNWPRWLNPQREKQRIIWGYKILFLDVLFPLSLKKIVFVDADQVVRTDLKELFEFDLEGNPYGYTPFCESRTEMDGFRFWKHGYWKSHLGRRKYHISALYVIDLLRFRKVAAGDRLRGQYQALSQDPNSLSNLDQDLPNNMIHQVGIKSLPQEWLWCETWCDDASKKHAKTIDLCNNPQTKEPKLDAAQRIVPEWKDYDTEIRNFQARVRDQETVEDEKRSKDKHTEL